jgi:hypothetical protein
MGWVGKAFESGDYDCSRTTQSTGNCQEGQAAPKGPGRETRTEPSRMSRFETNGRNEQRVRLADEISAVSAFNLVLGMTPAPRPTTARGTAGEDDARIPEERSKIKQVALGLRTAAAQIAIGALGGAGGNLLSG